MPLRINNLVRPSDRWKTLRRATGALALLFTCIPSLAWQAGRIDYSTATAKIIPLRGNISLLQVRRGEGIDNIGVLSGPEGYLLVDHPEAAAHPVVQKALDDFGKRPVRFLINTHWHYDHVGGNEIYAPDAVVIAHENVRKRLVTKQKPAWSDASIGPYPERAWPRITFRESVTIHFAGEDADVVHYANAHTDGDSIVYFNRANVIQTGDVFHGKGQIALGVDMEGLARMLAAVVGRINDDTIIITGHGELSNRREMAEYVELLNDAIAQVKQGIAEGKSDQQIQALGLPEKWKHWPAADNAELVPRLNHMIFRTLKDQDLDQ
jgi:cyclase